MGINSHTYTQRIMSCRASLLIKDSSVSGGCQFLLQYHSHHLHKNKCAESSRLEFKFNLNFSSAQYVASTRFHNTWSSSRTWPSHSRDADWTGNSCSFGLEMNRNWPVSHWQVTAHIFGQILEPVGDQTDCCRAAHTERRASCSSCSSVEDEPDLLLCAWQMTCTHIYAPASAFTRYSALINSRYLPLWFTLSKRKLVIRITRLSSCHRASSIFMKDHEHDQNVFSE